MHTDAEALENNSIIEGDVCIVGAGAAGISMALEWVDTPYNVILLEGGGFNVEAAVQDLYRGENLGQRYYPLQSSRLHFFGGTTGHWAGFCAPLDPIDFEKRDWVPYSGWPFAKSELDPFYARAQEVLELGPYEYDPAYWEEQDPEMRGLPLDETRVATKMWQFSPPTRFGTKYRDAIVGSENIELYTHANVTGIDANESVRKVEGLRIRCMSGKEHRVRAGHYILACGAIQNARILLASNHQAPAGIGNDHDLVGRFFMEHLEVRSAHLMMPAPGPMKMYEWTPFSTKARGELAPSSQQQRLHRILNCTASLSPKATTDDSPAMIDWFPDEAAETVKWWNDMEQAYEDGALPAADFSTVREFTLQSRLEQAPNPDSRVVLSAEKDALGVPRANLNWQLTPLDKRSIRETYEILGAEIGRTGLGRIRMMDWLLEDEPMWPSTLGGGWHHMGTARMHPDPKQGVVDADCRVHGLANLHVAGSAVYPTAGAANPTLTLVALALRLSDHVKTII